MTTFRNIIVIFIFLGLSSFHRPGNLGDLLESLRIGDANRMVTYLDQSVNLNIPGHDGAYAKTEAKKMIQLFFAQHPLKTFQLIHQTDLAAAKMCVGTLVTANASFRTTLLIQETAGVQVLKEIRFE